MYTAHKLLPMFISTPDTKAKGSHAAQLSHKSFMLRTLNLLLAHLIEGSDTRHSPLESDVVHCPCGSRLLLYLAHLLTLMAGSRAFVILICAFLFLLTLLLLHAVYSKSKN